MKRKIARMNSKTKFEKPFDWDTYSTRERLDNIVDRLSFIAKQEKYKQLRSRWCTVEQYNDEYGDEYNKYMMSLWLSCKTDYLERKNEYDSFIQNFGNNKNEHYKSCLELMNKVINDEIEDILLDADQPQDDLS